MIGGVTPKRLSNSSTKKPTRSAARNIEIMLSKTNLSGRINSNIHSNIALMRIKIRPPVTKINPRVKNCRTGRRNAFRNPKTNPRIKKLTSPSSICIDGNIKAVRARTRPLIGIRIRATFQLNFTISHQLSDSTHCAGTRTGNRIYPIHNLCLLRQYRFEAFSAPDG